MFISRDNPRHPWHRCKPTVKYDPVIPSSVLEAIRTGWRVQSGEAVRNMSLNEYIAYRRIEKKFWVLYWADKDDKTLGFFDRIEKRHKTGPRPPNDGEYDLHFDQMLRRKVKETTGHTRTKEPQPDLKAAPRPVGCQCKCRCKDASDVADESVSTRPPTYRTKDDSTTPYVAEKAAKKIPARYHRPFPKTAEKQPEDSLAAVSTSQPTKKVPARYHRPIPQSAEKQIDMAQSTRRTPARIEHQANEDPDAREAKALPARYRRCPARPGARSIRSALRSRASI